MRGPGEITFMCMVMFFIFSIDPKDPIRWHNAANALAALSCALMALVEKVQNVRGRKHLISGSSGSVFDVL